MPTEVSVLLGESIQLVCDADGVPTPVVQWLKDGKPLASDDLQRIRQAKISRHSILFLYPFKSQRALKIIKKGVLRGECKEVLSLRLRTSSPSLPSVKYFVINLIFFYFGTEISIYLFLSQLISSNKVYQVPYILVRSMSSINFLWRGKIGDMETFYS